MTAFAVRLLPAAEADIRSAFAWYAERNRTAAESFREEVFSTVEAIAKAPRAKSSDEEGNRKRALRRFPYSVFYVVEGDQVTILAIAHHRRRPAYWRSRER